MHGLACLIAVTNHFHLIILDVLMHSFWLLRCLVVAMHRGLYRPWMTQHLHQT